MPGLSIEGVEWLPAGADSGLVRVRGRWTGGPGEAGAAGGLPVLGVRASGAEHRFESLPDSRSGAGPGSWRGSYVVPAELVAAEPEAMWLELPGGARVALPALERGAPPAEASAVGIEDEAEEGGEVIDRAVLAERRARRAEAAEQAQARVAAEALRAVEALELRSAELERRLGAGAGAAELAALESRLAGARAV